VCNKEKNRGYVTLDDLEQRDLAQNDPALFFQLNKPPVTIDEIQYAPQLLNEIKIHVAKKNNPVCFGLPALKNST
jgi:predicted AAA+ superfamily ATPase